MALVYFGCWVGYFVAGKALFLAWYWRDTETLSIGTLVGVFWHGLRMDAAAAAYRPEVYAGSATVFKPRKNYNFFPDPKMGWGDCVTGGLEVVALPVNPHAMLMTPFVQHLARELRRRIDTIDARKGAPAGTR